MKIIVHVMETFRFIECECEK